MSEVTQLPVQHQTISQSMDQSPLDSFIHLSPINPIPSHAPAGTLANSKVGFLRGTPRPK